MINLRLTVPIVMKASSRAYVPFLRRMNVLKPTAMSDRKRKILERVMTASGRPVGVSNLAEGSTPFEGVAIAIRVQRKVRKVQSNKEEQLKSHLRPYRAHKFTKGPPPILAGALQFCHNSRTALRTGAPPVCSE